MRGSLSPHGRLVPDVGSTSPGRVCRDGSSRCASAPVAARSRTTPPCTCSAKPACCSASVWSTSWLPRMSSRWPGAVAYVDDQALIAPSVRVADITQADDGVAGADALAPSRQQVPVHLLDAPERAASDEQDRAVGQVQVGPDGWSPRTGTPRCRGCRRVARCVIALYEPVLDEQRTVEVGSLLRVPLNLHDRRRGCGGPTFNLEQNLPTQIQVALHAMILACWRPASPAGGPRPLPGTAGTAAGPRPSACRM